jgi:hypothetical protein
MSEKCQDKKPELWAVELNLLRYLHGFKNCYGYCPSYEQIKNVINSEVKSLSGVYCLIKKLQKDGYLVKEKSTARSLDILQKGYDAIDVKHPHNRIEWRLGIPGNEILAAHPTQLWAVKTPEGKLYLMEIPPLKNEEYCGFEDKLLCPIDSDFNKIPWPIVRKVPWLS